MCGEPLAAAGAFRYQRGREAGFEGAEVAVGTVLLDPSAVGSATLMTVPRPEAWMTAAWPQSGWCSGVVTTVSSSLLRAARSQPSILAVSDRKDSH
jgi:hypothetical protein